MRVWHIPLTPRITTCCPTRGCSGCKSKCCDSWRFAPNPWCVRAACEMRFGHIVKTILIVWCISVIERFYAIQPLTLTITREHHFEITLCTIVVTSVLRRASPTPTTSAIIYGVIVSYNRGELVGFTKCVLVVRIHLGCEFLTFCPCP